MTEPEQQRRRAGYHSTPSDPIWIRHYANLLAEKRNGLPELVA